MTDTPPLPDDSRWMRRALELARRGWGQVSPNPLVGAVVVKDGQAVGEGWHARFGEAHAEVAALAQAGDRARGATVYVTLEPCTHVGKTPPCVDALVAAGVGRVVVATHDPNPEAAGGLASLRAAGIATTSGVEEAAARELLAPFLFSHASDRPWVTLKLAVSIDAAIADAAHTCTWLTGPESRAEVHRLRAGHDAVAVGIRTALIDDPVLTVREVALPRVPPVRVVLDRQARLPLDGWLARTAREVPVLVIAAPGAPEVRLQALEAAGVSVRLAEDLPDAMRALRARGIRSLLVEGGAAVAGALLRHALVDRLIIFQAPVVLGEGALGAFSGAPAVAADGAPRLRVVERRTFGDDLMTVFALREP